MNLHNHTHFRSVDPLLTVSPAEQGRYRVSPLVRASNDGGYSSGVSIRSGCGSATTDRVMRFNGRFATESDARQHAQAQAAIWLAERARGLHS